MKYEKNDVFVSTVCAFDTGRYETAISHPFFNDNELIIVEEYDSSIDAEHGHKKWIKMMTAKKLPKQIKDISTCGIAMLRNAFSDKEDNVYKLKE